ncbi:MAG: succinate dehydrogenase cytochrome b subunit [Bacteroidetes bacterium]|nr:succinate dehydrogenase cytochrome b subunit [Bacteroidota bacterium]MCW5895642.1 succinate dehydrogenase cytochrome b subunit [Bacteroidota bacterium]
MGKTATFLSSSVGRKITMALSGLFLCSFLVVHLTINLFALQASSGNTAEFRGAEMFEIYGHFMATHPIIRPLEWGLFAGFLLHAILGIYLYLLNRKARPIQYEVNKASENSTWSSRFGWLTGILVGVFLVVHVNTFFVESRFLGKGPMIQLMIDAFSSPAYVAFYIVALVFLAYHLKHGFQSAFQTFGVRSGKLEKLVHAIGIVFWLLIPVGFAIIPLYFLFAY